MPLGHYALPLPEIAGIFNMYYHIHMVVYAPLQWHRLQHVGDMQIEWFRVGGTELAQTISYPHIHASIMPHSHPDEC